MTQRRLLTAGTIVLLSLSLNVMAQTDFFRVEDLRPGMKGVGKTCYQGSKPEEFQVEILGVMRGIGPGSDAVLARLSGGPLDRTGVFEGMSGSPVFIDGKLLGAVAFSFPFAKEAIGGITPITQMVNAFKEETDSTGVFRIVPKKSMLWRYQLELPEAEKRGQSIPVTALDALMQPALAPFTGHSLLPIATPLSLGGFSAEALNAFTPQFKALGLSVLQGSGRTALQGQAGASGSAADNAPLEPGSNIVIPLVRGDLDASAGGTVTYISGDKVYAFGHPLFNLGFTEFPMYKGRAITVFPSLQSSFKILESTDPVGVLRQDRGSGIFGLLGEKAKMIPMHVQMTTSRGVVKNLNYEIARDRFLTPFLVNLTVYNTIVGSERALGVSTLRVKGKINLKGEKPVEIENRFSSDSNSPVFASMSVAVPVNFLLASGYNNLELEDIDLEISAVEEDRAALLDSLRFDRTELKSGESFNLDIFYQRSNGEVLRDTNPVKIPSGITPGPLTVMVADGTSIMQMDAQEQGSEVIPRDLSQLVRLINNIRKNDRLYVRMYRRQAGAFVNGEGLPGLPPSIISILKSERNTGSMSPIRNMVLAEYELPANEYVVSGSKLFDIEIKP